MGILNKEELRKQIKEGKGIDIESILDEFLVLALSLRIFTSWSDYNI